MAEKTARRSSGLRITRDQKGYIDELFARNGGKLQPESLLLDAQKPKSPIHDLFTWNDRRGAHLNRLREASRVLRSYAVIKVKYSEAEGEIVRVEGPIAIKVKHTVEGPKEWTKREAVLRSDELTHFAMVDMIARVRAWNRQLKVFPKLLPLYEQLEAVISAFKIEGEKERAVN